MDKGGLVSEDQQISNEGTIKKVEVKNFMCHEHLVVDLVRGINFITGSNGSGKSAVLTALTVCLGCRASATQRGTSFDRLIKEGCNTAEVSVTICNGQDRLAFRFDQYGEFIIIERTLKRDGQHSFKVKNGTTGRVVESKKDEVVAICDHHSLLVDNPLVVLTQETSKKFLVNSTPKDLYSFFLKATQLEQLQEDYTYTEGRIESMNSIINTAKSGWPEKIKKIKELEGLMRDFEKLRDSANILKSLKTEMAWNLVHQKEAEVDELQSDANKLQADVQERSRALDEKKVELERMVEQLREDIEEQSQISNKIRPKEEEKRKLEFQLREAQSQLQSCINDALAINREVQENRQKKADIEERLGKDSSEADKNNLKNKLLQEKNVVQTSIAELESKMSEASGMERNLNNEKMELYGQVERYKSQRLELESSVNSLERKKVNLENAKNNRLQMFGERMPDAMKAIAKNTTFQKAPIGPLALHCSLKDPKWSLAMEAICGRELDSFIVHDHHDRALLAGILKSFGLQNGILVVNFEKELSAAAFSNRGTDFGQHAFMAYDLLEVTNKIVLKALVINNSIERALFVDSREEAMNIMRSRPNTIDVTFTTSHQIRAGQKSVSCFALYQNSNGSSFRSEDSTIKSLSKDILEMRGQIKDLESQIVSIEAKISSLVTQQSKLSSEKNARRKELDLLNSDFRRINDEISELSTESCNYLAEESSKIDLKIAQFARQFEAIAAKQVRLQNSIFDIESAIADISNEMRGLIDRRTIISEKSSQLSSSKRACEFDISKISKSIDGDNVAQKSILGRLEVGQNVLAKMTADAQTLGDRIYSKRTASQIDKSIIEMTVRLEQAKSKDIDPYKLKSDLMQHQDEYEKSRNEVLNGENLLVDMKRALDKRQRVMEEFRIHIAKSSNIEFILLLSTRGFVGNLDYKHCSKELYINILVDSPSLQNPNRVEVARRDIKQLSGGEKSFGTACFLLSLWESMGAPIRCLDEFDVFMDAINRRTVLEMLVDHARTNHFQFILITPIPVNDFLASNPDIHVVRLRDPSR